MSKLTNINLAWDNIQWSLIKDRVRRVQRRIYKAKRSGQTNKKIHWLQKLLINSLDAKLWSVYRVTTLNKGKNTAGIDGFKNLTSKQKIALANDIRLDGKASPIRRVWIRCSFSASLLTPKGYKSRCPVGVNASLRLPLACPPTQRVGGRCPVGVNASLRLPLACPPTQRVGGICPVGVTKPGKSEKRPLGIPTIKDRAKQTLAKLALEPEWEAVFEPNSYGFRPGRSCPDAIEAIFLALHHKTPKWVFDADIRKCFDRIDQKELLDKLQTFPEMKEQIRVWLKADIMEGYANSPKEVSPSLTGTPQGGAISPLLANIALHGLENHLKDFVTTLPSPRKGANRGKVAKQKALTIVRYADDFVLIHENIDILKPCIEEATKWLAQIGLELNTDKSTIRDGRLGFKFLGFQIIQIRKDGHYKVKITPSKENQVQFLKKIRKIIQLNKTSSAYKLIRTLRPVIIGWANYHRYCECKQVFSKLTNAIFTKIRAWVFRRDTRNGRKVVKERYFPTGREWSFKGTLHQDNWILFGKQKLKGEKVKEAFLPHIVWVPSVKYVKVKGDKSPFDGDVMYWGTRLSKFENLPTRTKTLLKRQKMCCTACNKPFTTFDHLEVDHITPTKLGGKDSYDNLQVLHRSCHVRKTSTDLSL